MASSHRAAAPPGGVRRERRFFADAIGDLPRAVVPTGTKAAGTRTGRVAVRTAGLRDVATARGLVRDTRHQPRSPVAPHGRPPHTRKKEEGVSFPA